MWGGRGEKKGGREESRYSIQTGIETIIWLEPSAENKDNQSNQVELTTKLEPVVDDCPGDMNRVL